MSQHVFPEGVKHDTYQTIEGTINSATTTDLAFTTVLVSPSYMIANDGLVPFTVTYNAVTTNDAQTIAAGEVFTDNGFEIVTPIRMINASTTSCDYRIRLNGVNT